MNEKKLSEMIFEGCCGSTGEKTELIKEAIKLQEKNKELEREYSRMEGEINIQSLTINNLRSELTSLENRGDDLECEISESVEKAFRAGYTRGMNFSSDPFTEWLKYCSEQGIDP